MCVLHGIAGVGWLSMVMITGIYREGARVHGREPCPINYDYA